MKIHRFADRRRLTSRGAVPVLALDLPPAALEAYSDGDSSKTSESKVSYAGKEGQPEKGQSEGDDSSAENESPPGGVASNDEQGADEGDGTTALDGSSGGASATPSGSSARDGSTPGDGKAADTGAPSLNSPTGMRGWKAGQTNSGRILSKSKRGCFLSAERQQAEGAQSGECRMTEDAVNHHLTELQQGRSNFRAEPSGRTKLRGAGGAEVDGVANIMTCADAGGKNYRGWH